MRLSEILFYKLEKIFFGYQERPGTLDLFDLTNDHIKCAEEILKKGNVCTLHLYGRYNLKKLIKHFDRKGYRVELLDADVLRIWDHTITESEKS